jgi:hypothetical protein
MMRVLLVAGLVLGAVAGAPSAFAQLRFVTVVPAAANTTVPDEDGDYPAYIEIRSLETGIVSGHFLTDSPNSPNKWQFPGGYVLTSGQTLRIFASGKDRRPIGPNGILHTSFTYDCNVPYAGLFNVQSALVHTFADRTDRCPCDGVSLIGRKTTVRTLIPLEDPGADWTLPGFDDSKWIRGLTGVGYESGASPFQDGLVLYHTLDKGDVTDKEALDMSGPILHPGALSGSPPMVTGRVGQGLEFKGEPGTHLRTKHHPELDPGSGAFSASVWFRAFRGGSATVGFNFTEFLLAKVGPPASASQTPQGWGIVRNQSGTFVQLGSNLGVRTVSLGQTGAGQWNHVVLVVDRAAGLLIGYLNGKRIGATPLSTPTAETIGTTGDLFEGRDAAGVAAFAGVLDDIAIWKRSLTDAQVQDLYAAGSAGKSLLDSTAFPVGSQMFGGLIGTDVLPQMKGIHTSAFIRVPFNLPSVPFIATGLRLRVHYTDGFVAYLNGLEVARRNAPVELDYLAAAVEERPDALALAAETFDISPYAALLKPGANVLAFHGLNHKAEAERFLVAPVQLCLKVERDPTQGDDCVRETNGREFWVAFPENYTEEPDNPLRLSLTIAGAPGTHGLVDVPGLALPGFPKPFTVPPAGSLVVDLPRKVELKGTDVIEPKGVHVLATADVAVYGVSRMDFTTDTYLGLPNTCLGTEYLVSTYRNVFNGIPILNGTQFAIVAVANDTKLTLTPSGAVAGHPAQQPFFITLQRGETYQLRNEAGQPADLTGTRIASTKPVAVFGSHRCANLQSVNQFFCDTVVEELLPLSSWGVSHFVVPLATRKADTLRILSGADDNLVTVTTTSGSENFVLPEAGHKDLILDKPSRVTSRGPVLVMQFANSSDADQVIDADPFMALIQPTETWLSRYRLRTPPASEFADHYLNLVGVSASVLDLTTINGVALTAWDPARITRGPLPGGYAFAKVRIDAGNSYQVLGRAPLGLTSYGFSEFDSYGHPGGMRFSGSAPPQLTCPQEIVLHCDAVAGAADCLAAVPDLTLQAEIFDDCKGGRGVSITQTPKAGTLLKPGTYAITLFVSDSDGETAQCTTKLVVEPRWEEKQFGATVVSNPSLEATVWGAQADPDLDGLSNEMEEALGTSPNQRNGLGSLLTIVPESPGQPGFPLLITLPQPRRQDAPAIELETLEALDGSPWIGGPDIFELLPGRSEANPDGRTESVTYRVRHPISATISNTLFLRVRLRP